MGIQPIITKELIIIVLKNNGILAKTNTLSAALSVAVQVPGRDIFRPTFAPGNRFFNLFLVLVRCLRNYNHTGYPDRF